MSRKLPPKREPVKTETSTEATARQGITALAEMISRSTLSAYLGKQYGTDRDLYKALGYKLNPDSRDYMARFRRHDIARRIVRAPVSACWAKPPRVYEDEDEKLTPFEEAWEKLVREQRVWHYFRRADTLSRLGRYAVLVLGTADGGKLETPLEKAQRIAYLRPYGEESAQIQSVDEDSASERYGLPTEYALNTRVGEHNATKKVGTRIHHTRVLHVAEELLEDDVYGEPIMALVLNRLMDIEKIVGGSGEMYWRGAFPGYAFEADPEAQITAQTKTELETQIQNYLHNLERYIRVQGITVKELGQQIADPAGAVDVQVQMISAATGIPKRILLGAERGELASTQDERAWDDRVEERRRDHCELQIVRPFVDRMIQLGVLPEPKSGEIDEYKIDWPDLQDEGEADRAAVAKTRTEALCKYADSPGAESVLPVGMFLTKVMGFDQSEVEDAQKQVEEQAAEEQREIEKQEKEQAQAQPQAQPAQPGTPAGPKEVPKQPVQGAA